MNFPLCLLGSLAVIALVLSWFSCAAFLESSKKIDAWYKTQEDVLTKWYK